MKIFDSAKREHHRNLNAKKHMSLMEKDETISELSKKHMRHKPYECDFGGVNNGRD